jgi:hypothetical protein
MISKSGAHLAHRTGDIPRKVCSVRVIGSQPRNVHRGQQIWHTGGTQHWCPHDFGIARDPAERFPGRHGAFARFNELGREALPSLKNIE